MIRIYVDSQAEKDELIRQSEYIHDFCEIIKCKDKWGKKYNKYIGLDSDQAGTLMHIYMAPEIIIVRTKQN